MMKKSIRLIVTVMAPTLLLAVTACAGSGKMEDRHVKDPMKSDQMKSEDMKSDPMKSDQMMDKKMDDGMKDSGMSDETMTKEKMHKETMAAPMMSMLSGSDGHHATGKVSLSREMGTYVLTLADIKVDKVPDGHVYLAKDGDRKAGLHLGMLKRFTGTVTFALPAEAQPDMYDSVIIYCEKFDVEIGRAHFAKQM